MTAVVLHTDMARTGDFTTSHPLLRRFHDNVVWGMRGNFLSLPTDCPQRDARLGWTGDIQVFAPTAAFLCGCDAFLRSWWEDVRLEQRAAGGGVPMVVPAVIPQVPGLLEPVAAWGTPSPSHATSTCIRSSARSRRPATGNGQRLAATASALRSRW